MRLIKLIISVLLAVALCPALCAADRAASSVLASGTWRKVSVQTTGVYCLTKSQLAQMGFSDPASVRVYGAGGRQMNFVAARDTRDDLYALPAVHTSDGVLFYAEGPDAWNISGRTYSLNLNAYSRKAYYYVTTGQASDAPAPADEPTDPDEVTDIDTYDNRFAHATQSVNVGSMGRYWFSNYLPTSKPSVTIPLDMACVAGTDVKVSYLMGAASRAAGSFSITVDGETVVDEELSTTSSYYYNYVDKSGSATFPAPSSRMQSCTVSVAFTSAAAGAYLGTLTVQAKAPLAMSGSELRFRDSRQFDADGDAVRFQVSGAPSDTRVWDVTTPWNPTECGVSVGSGVASFTSAIGTVHEYAAFSPSGSFPSPTDEGPVSNHDLHSHKSVNYLVVTAPAFESYARRLCTLHESLQGLSTRIVMVDDIYDEFSAGRAEAPAIRDYAKMLYDRGQDTDDQLKYILLLGGGSYDNFDRSKAQNVIPTYQSTASSSILTSYCTDDYYGWLLSGGGSSDIQSREVVGVGRIPCTTAAMAEAYVSKVESYMQKPEQGDWRAKAIFVGQSGDSNEHQGYADRQATNFEEENPDMDAVRVFSEAYTRVVSSTGTSYPMAAATATGYLQSGCSLYHFTGHAGAYNTGEGYFSRDIASNLTNGGKGFLLVAATCQLAPFDMSTGNCSEDALFNACGGAIGVFAATRETYGGPNYTVTRSFVQSAYSTTAAGQNTLGTATMKAKQGGPRSINTLKYALLGDPALVIATPRELYVSIDSVNGVARSEADSPLKALAKSVVSCSVRNADGSLAESFSGKATVSLYDKRTTRQTSGLASGTPMAYEEWGARVFSGEVEVKDGIFEASFILSKEFDLSVGYGRLTAYAEGDDGRDAMGSADDILVGGVADVDLSDSDGPAIKVWVDYERDADGNKLSDTPYLHAAISDEQGINTSGMGVGHDISLVIDDDRAGAISLNNYFAYDVGSHTSGTLAYPLTLVAGKRVTLTLKAWDNLNNSSSVSILVDLTGEAEWSVLTSLDPGSLSIGVKTDAPAAEADIVATLYSLTGRKVASGRFTAPLRNGLSAASLPLGSLTAGVYVLYCEVSAGGKSSTISKKILIKAQ